MGKEPGTGKEMNKIPRVLVDWHRNHYLRAGTKYGL